MLKFGLLFISVLQSACLLWAQIPFQSLADSRFYLNSKMTVHGYPVPDYFEEKVFDSLITFKGEAMHEQKFSRFTTKGQSLETYPRKTYFSVNAIQEWKKNEVWHSIDRSLESQKGVICGKKGTIKRSFIEQQHPKVAPMEHFILEEDSSCFIIYRPELQLIELENIGILQRRALIGHLFNQIGHNQPGELLSTPMSRSYSIGDQTEVLFITEQLDSTGKFLIQSPTQLIINTITQVTKGEESDEIRFETYVTDVTTGTREFVGNNIMTAYTEGITIGSDLVVADTGQKQLLHILPYSTPVFPHPFYPLQTIEGPSVEAYWNDTSIVENSRIPFNCYYTSLFPARICWNNDLPFVWRDNGEGLQGRIVYLKKGEKVLGNSYSVPTNSKTHIQEIGLLNQKLTLNMFAASKETVTMTTFNNKGEKISSTKLKLNAGNTPFELEMIGIESGQTLRIQIQSNNKKAELIQEYQLTSRSNP